MTPKYARNLIQKTYLAAIGGDFLVALDNQRFNPPEESLWVRLSIQFTVGRQESLGIKTNRKFLKSGIIFIQVFTPGNSATDENDIAAERSLDVFEGEHLEELWFNNGSIRSVGRQGAWYQQNVVLEFTHEQIK